MGRAPWFTLCLPQGPRPGDGDRHRASGWASRSSLCPTRSYSPLAHSNPSSAGASPDPSTLLKTPCSAARAKAAGPGPWVLHVAGTARHGTALLLPAAALRPPQPTKGELSAPARPLSRGRSDGLSPVKREGN